MTYTKRQREDYNIHRARVCVGLDITINQYNYLRRLADKLHTVYENDCNGLYETEYEKNIAENDIVTQILNYRGKLIVQTERALYFHLQTDPRGATLYMDTKPIPENNYNNAHCIY